MQEKKSRFVVSAVQKKYTKGIYKYRKAGSSLKEKNDKLYTYITTGMENRTFSWNKKQNLIFIKEH
ncbi:MAG: hypothetical protein EHM58_02105 [Ignavibacteriae bacterium]|nr:MAG: hypothetical protein EHM58_02105 [Ignavibacteriota bacterium]